jgi:addiction module HigA family antidote
VSGPTRGDIAAALYRSPTAADFRLNTEACNQLADAVTALLAETEPLGQHWRPVWGVHPGEILQEEINERGMTQVAFADQLGCAYQHVNRICRGHVDIEAPFALRLEKALGISAELWLRLQMAWDLHELRAAASDVVLADESRR